MGELFAVSEDILEELEGRVDLPVARVAALALLKANRISIGIYSLVLDCLGQEAGALFRVLQEAWEFLMYLRMDITRVNAILDHKIPRAGEIAKAIEGRFAGLRKHLNQHAAHLSFTPDAMGHIVDMSKGTLRIDRSPDAKVIRRNMAVLFGILFLAAGEAVAATAEEHMTEQLRELATRLEDVRDGARGPFDMDSILDATRSEHRGIDTPDAAV